MRSILVSIMALFLAMCLLLLGNGLLTTLLALRGGAEGFSGRYLGMLASVYFLGAFVATLMASTLIKRMGHIRCFTFCTALVGCSILAYTLLISPIAWLVIRFITGFGVFAIYTVIESWLNGQTPDVYRSRVFSVYTLMNLSAIAASQQLLRIDSATGGTLFILGSLLVTAAIMPASWTRLQQPHVSLDLPAMSVFKLFEAAPVAVTGVFVSGLIMGPLWGLTPLFVTGLGYSENQLSVFISLSILGGAVIQYPFGRWSDFMDRRRVLLVAFVCGTLLALLMVLAASYMPLARTLMTMLSVVFCGLLLSVYPLSVAHLVDRINKDQLVAGSSGLLMIYGLGSFTGPALAGLALEFFGRGGLPAYYFIILGLFSLILLAQLIRSGIVEYPKDHEGKYVSMIRTSANVLPLHPDSEEPIRAPDEIRG